MRSFLFLTAAATASTTVLAAKPLPTYSATYLPYNAPKTTEEGQTGTNQCGTESSQISECQNAYINAIDDFCLWAPPSNKSSYGDSAIGNTERLEVAWCLRSGYGTRLIPPGAITGAHFVQTPDYVQITGAGDLTKLNIPKGDAGGELDPHGADGNGNPIGGLVFGTSFNGTLRQYHEWTNFMSSGNFCFRACVDGGPNAPGLCQHIYDVMGCGWNMPGNYSNGFSSCEGDSTEPMGVYVENGVTTTFHQGDAVTPLAHAVGASSSCTYYPSITNLNDAAPTPSASLLPSSVSASLSTASLASVESVSSVSTGSVATAPTSSRGTASTPSATGNKAVSPNSARSATALSGTHVFYVLSAVLAGYLVVV